MSDELTYYATPGPMTDLTSVPLPLFEGLPDDPAGLMRVVRGLVTSGDLLQTIHQVEVPPDRGFETAIKPVAEMIARITELDPSPLVEARKPTDRLIGNCRSFATLSCALFRRAGIPTRVRAGFAGYFQPNTWADHWIIEYRSASDEGWVRVDPELDDDWLAKRAGGVTSQKLAQSMYWTGAEAWRRCRRGELDPERCNMGGVNWGIGEVRGSVLLDLAAINQDEMLPWDTWGQMVDAYNGKADEAYDELLDAVSEIVEADDLEAIRRLYGSEPLLRAV